MVRKALIDVGILVLGLEKNNPLRQKYLEIIEKCVKGKIEAYIPYTVILGTYHVLTTRFKVDSSDALDILKTFMGSRKIKWISDMDHVVVLRSLETASKLRVESWDGYILALAKRYGIQIIYSIDTDLAKEEGIEVHGLPTAGEKSILDKYLRNLKKLKT